MGGRKGCKMQSKNEAEVQKAYKYYQRNKKKIYAKNKLSRKEAGFRTWLRNSLSK